MNEVRQSVRHRPRDSHAGPAEDRRKRRTREALTRALLGLALEKRYGAITIQDLLDRADVGRSTFYAHYRGKDDLLLRSFERLLEMLDGCVDRDEADVRRIAPVRELFRHVGEARTFHQALASAHMLERLYECGVQQVTRSITRRIAMMPDGAAGAAGAAGARVPADTAAGVRVPATVVARSSAGALFSLLRWWVDNETAYTPERVDEMFHAMVMPAVGLVRASRSAPSSPPDDRSSRRS